MTTTRSMGELGAGLFLVVAATVSLSSTALAQTDSTGSLWLGLGAGHSDNVRRSSELPDSGSYSALTLESDLAYQSRRIELGFDADLQRRHYSLPDLEDETYGYAQFAFEIDAVPDRFSWVVLDDYRQGRVDPFEVSSPENRAGLNDFSTGPRLNLPLGARSLLRVEALKGERSVADLPDLDSETRDSSLAYVRVLSSATEFAVNVSARELDYEFLQARNSKITRAFLSYSRQLASGQALLALGSNRLEFGTETSSTPYIDLAWSRDVGARSRLEIAAVQEYVDVFDDNLFGGISDAVLDAGIYRQQLVSVAYSVEGVRNAFRVEQSLTRADYATGSAFDYDLTGTSIQYTRSFTGEMSLAIDMARFVREFAAAPEDDESIGWSVSLDKRIGRRFSLQVRYESWDDESAFGSGVEANVVRVFFRYALADRSTG